MDPLITNGIDPALLRVLEKRGQERETVSRRKRLPSPEASEEDNKAEDQDEGADGPKHELDDLA